MIDQASQGPALPRPAALGMVSGIFFLTFFGAYWGFVSAAFMSGTTQIIAFLLVGLITLGFLGIGIRLLRSARALPQVSSPEDVVRGKRIWRLFSIVFGIEIVLIGLSSTLLSIFQGDLFIAPVIALIVGAHFFPLARLFRVPLYFLTGSLLVVLALIALIALLLHLPIAGPSPYNWAMFVGIGATLVLWLTVLAIIRSGLSILQPGVKRAQAE